jgi:predicted AAA+ superfamily ATPase
MFAAVQDGPVSRFDLEDPADLAQFDQPKLALSSLEGLVVIDEIQRTPELFPLLRVLADREHNAARFLVLGSASRDLIQQTSESLAGRVKFIELTPFTLRESGEMPRLWTRGGFPLSFLAENEQDSWDWRVSYVRTFLERDIPALGIRVPARTLQRFWTMLAHYHGNVMNLSELGRSLGCADNTVRHYLDILAGTFMVRQLMPWFVNVGKRQVKAPKVYIRDSGILHALLGLASLGEVCQHPKLGASWEGFALEEVIRAHHAHPEECYFWATHGGAELDLLIDTRGRRLGFEFKYADAPRRTRSMTIAQHDLDLDALTVIYPDGPEYKLADGITAVALEKYVQLLG